MTSEQRAILRLVEGEPSWCAMMIEQPTGCVAGMDAHLLLEACQGVEQADAWQDACGLFEAISVGELDAERRAALVALLRFGSPFARRVAA